MQELVPPFDFENTELAFQAKSNAKLIRTYWLFRMIDNPWLTRWAPKLLNWALRVGLPVKGLVRRTIFELFVGGETLAETAQSSAFLERYGVGTILDYSVEAEKNEAGFEQTKDEIIATLAHAAQHPSVKFIACKLTGLASFALMEKIQAGAALSYAEQSAYERVVQRLEAITQAALAYDTPLFIDAEESWIQDFIDSMVESLMETYNLDRPLIWITIQLYRHDRIYYLRELIQRSRERGYVLGVKLVRGAYLERENQRAGELGYPTPMQPSKRATDRDFDAALAFCVRNLHHVAVCAGTHNERSSRYLAHLMRTYGIEANHPHIWFSQLLGMSDHISFNLAHHGYNVAKYLPYGPVEAVMPYLIRRAEENTAIAGQSSRERQLLHKELKRRGQNGKARPRHNSNLSGVEEIS
jgi:proline dehydrogenase